MDDVPRGRRLFLSVRTLAIAFGIGAACAVGAVGCDRPPESPAGVSNAGVRKLSSPSADAGVAPTRELDLLPRDFRTKYGKLSSARYASSGHAAGRFEAEVYANQAAHGAYPKHTGEFPAGAVFVKEHWERSTEPPSPGPLMAMQKMAKGYDTEHGDWRYVVVSPEGEVLVDGKPEGCVLCHDDAPHDRVFRIGQ